MIRTAPILVAGLLTLAGCGAATKTAVRPAVFIAPPLMLSGLDRVMGHDARALITLFGPANQDVREENARKLQFGSGICILDAYLYPPAKGKEPLVNYLDARQPDGAPIDRASCIAALTRRKEAR